MNIIPKKVILCGLAICGAVMLNAQTIFEDYQDGKIWFKLKSEFYTAPLENENPYNLPLSTLSFLSDISQQYSISKLSRPFHAAKNSEILLNTYLIEFNNYSKVMDIITLLEASEYVDYAERVPLDKICATPNDPKYNNQWHLTKINAPTAWNYYSSPSNVVVAIVDDAVSRTHQDLKSNIWINTGDSILNGIDDDNNGYTDDINGYDIADIDNNPDPPTSSFDHGTHLAGIAGATTNNSTGIASIGYNIKLMCVKSSNIAGMVTNGYDGIVYAVTNGADVINLSWGSTNSSSTGQSTINWAYSQGAIIVAAAGNNNSSTLFYPAAYNNVLAVAGSTSTDTKLTASNYGSWVDVSAPSIIYSTLLNDTYGNKTGTSMASPLVAGLCALMKSYDTSLTQSTIIDCIKNTAVNIDALNTSYQGKLGTGRIDAAAAMYCIATTGIESSKNNESNNIKLFYDTDLKILKVNIPSQKAGSVKLINNLGQIIAENRLNVTGNEMQTMEFNLSSKAIGIYYVEWIDDNTNFTEKVIVY